MARKPESVIRNAEAATATIQSISNTAQGDDKPIDATAHPDSQAQPQVETPATTSTGEPLNKPLGADADPWEQRYRILQGKYNAEVPALHEENRKLKDENARLKQASQPGISEELNQLRNENADLKRKLEAGKTPEINSPDLDALREQFPPELVDGILAAVRGIVAPLQKRVDDVGNTVVQSSKANNVDRLRSVLKASGISFDQINTDPVFVQDFLGERAPYSSQTKAQLLAEAFEGGDIERAASFFIDYAGSRASASSARNSQGKIDEHVSVHGTGQGGNPSTSRNVWTETSIAQFYEDKRRGKYTPDEAKALEADLFASMNNAG